MAFDNNLLLDTFNGNPTPRPPVWLMRQAGRILPQYRAIRGSLSGFKELVQTPHLAAEVTIQPVDELNVDAAIIFSDILVIPECMGLDYDLIEKVGPRFPETINSLKDVESLDSGKTAAERLGYVYDAVSETVRQLDGRVPLIGFCGAPWTLLCYMVEGKGSKTFSKARAFLMQNPKAAHLLLDKITESCIEYLKLKVKAGVSVVQVFDSWSGVLSADLYNEFAMPYINRILDSITEVPKIVFAKGAWFVLEELGKTSADAVGLDWTIDPEFALSKIDDKIFQGNFDPAYLLGNKEDIPQRAHDMLNRFPKGKHIVNLGHGVYPETPLENVKTFINTIQGK